MSKAAGKMSMRAMRVATENEHIRNRYLRRMEQYEKWRHTYEVAAKKEERLNNVSRISYDEKDYSLDLVRKEWTPAPPPNFGDWRGKIEQEVERQFQTPILVHGIAIFLLFAGMLLVQIMMVLSVLLILEGLLAFSLYLTFRKKRRVKEDKIEEKHAYIRAKMYEFLLKQKADKEEFDKKETERVALVERLINGEESAILPRLTEIYRTLSFPFPLEVQVLLHQQMPLFKIWLPTIDVVPERLCLLKDDGSLDYQDKPLFSRNKQYLELCAAVILQIISVAYGNIPAFDEGIVWGMVKRGDEEKTYFSLALTRTEIIEACRSVSGVGGLQKLQGLYQWDESCQLTPVETMLPDEWKDVASLYDLPQIRVTLF